MQSTTNVLHFFGGDNKILLQYHIVTIFEILTLLPYLLKLRFPIQGMVVRDICG